MDFKELFFRNLVRNWHKPLANIGLTPEALTLFRVIFGIITALFIFAGINTRSIVLLIAYQFILILDYVDGNLARYEKRFSKNWLYFDYFAHYFITVLLLVSLAINSTMTYLLPLAIISSLLFSLMGLIDLLRPPKKSEKQAASKMRDFVSFMVVEAPFSPFFFGVLFNLVNLTVLIYSIFYILGSIYKLKNFLV